MGEIGRLVVRACANGGEALDQEAFSGLVLRFQDMAHATAYAILGDHSLAEDAAQEAFVTAWLKLRNLREPDAFPGWFRQIVIRECSRTLRRTESAVPLDQAGLIPGDPETEVFIERLDRQDAFASLLAGLSDRGEWRSASTTSAVTGKGRSRTGSVSR